MLVKLGKCAIIMLNRWLKGELCMLLEFSCSNHKSIRDEILFSTVASSDNTFEDRLMNFSNIKILKSAVIYGANGSGKSNFIDAIAFVKKLVMDSINNQPGQGIQQTPHKLDGFEQVSSYKVQFVKNDVRYVFCFSLKNMLVVEEYLYYFPNNKQTRIFERSCETVIEGSKFRGKFSSCKDVLKPNRLFLSCAANFSSVLEIADAYNFFSNDLIIYGPESQENWLNYSLFQMGNDPRLKMLVLKFLKELDTEIKDIDIFIDQKKLDVTKLPPFLSDDFKKDLLQKEFSTISAKIVYDKFEVDFLQEESSGVKKLIGLLCPLIDIMISGKVLICDELESSLHESLLYGLVKLFVEVKNSDHSQMIFTTHETGLLNLDLFRRDQIWFTEMRKEDRSTDLYSLAEIKNVRKEDNFEKGYVSGKYGAIPMLNLNFADIVSKE